MGYGYGYGHGHGYGFGAACLGVEEEVQAFLVRGRGGAELGSRLGLGQGKG